MRDDHTDYSNITLAQFDHVVFDSLDSYALVVGLAEKDGMKLR